MMSVMISYAQNQEDVVLARLLDLIPTGFFIDVGAGHPILENVTYGLYRAGWRGINIEPMPREAEMLRAERPEDVTLELAVADRVGKITLFEAPLDNRGATTADPTVVARYEAAGQMFTAFDAESVPLSEVWERHVTGDVHLLKIDVEGMELEVLRGADLMSHHPWVIVIEATAPNSTEQTWQSWEPVLLDAGYQFTQFDGLNRFYVHSDHAELAALLSVPANVFDQWHSHRQALADERAERAEASLHDLEDYVASVVDRASRAEQYAATLERARADAEPHIARMKVALAAVPELERRVAELSAQLEDALRRLSDLQT
jgi:FkbM family methyltransferase